MAVASAGVVAERAEVAAPHPKAVPIAAGALGRDARELLGR